MILPFLAPRPPDHCPHFGYVRFFSLSQSLCFWRRVSSSAPARCSRHVRDTEPLAGFGGSRQGSKAATWVSSQLGGGGGGLPAILLEDRSLRPQERVHLAACLSACRACVHVRDRVCAQRVCMRVRVHMRTRVCVPRCSACRLLSVPSFPASALALECPAETLFGAMLYGPPVSCDIQPSANVPAELPAAQLCD